MTKKLVTYPLATCLAYNIQFRQLVARYPTQVKWEQPSVKTESVTFNSRSPAPPPSLATPPSRPRVSASNQQYSAPTNPASIYNNYNLGICPTTCKFNRLHFCNQCGQDHKACDNHRQAPKKLPGPATIPATITDSIQISPSTPIHTSALSQLLPKHPDRSLG
jgi:hypothetical protein